ncbi:endonuclease domain-containing protein [Sphingomonas sp. 1P08PE]|uniref:endonuclease domain-containing protein n=1 Tax=Sphingomonas sp. 1P08PE TaxID=554122 RepID=UPI00399F409D
MPRLPPLATERARELRNNATAQERAIWHRVRHHRPRFTRQLPIGPYVVDLACRTRRIAIEFDGSQHLESGGYDARRTAFLRDLGWTVLRFWNSEVDSNPDGVAAVILATVDGANGPTHPRPLPVREGS